MSQTVVSWSSTAQSICPVTIGVSTASQAAASAAGPVRYTDPGPAAASAGVQDRSSTEPAAQVVQVDVHGQVRRLAVPAGDQLPANQPPARLLDRIVAALRRGAGIFRPRLLPQRLQHHRQRRRARRGQVRAQPPGPPERGAQPQRPLLEPVAVPVRAGLGAVEHLPRQPRQIMLIRAAQHRRQQNPVRVRPEIFRELVRPVTDQPRQRDGELPCASAAAITGCAPSRRAHPAAAAAAPLVTRVIARSQDAGP